MQQLTGKVPKHLKAGNFRTGKFLIHQDDPETPPRAPGYRQQGYAPVKFMP